MSSNRTSTFWALIYLNSNFLQPPCNIHSSTYIVHSVTFTCVSSNRILTFWAIINKLKSLKVAQLKDEMDDDEDDGCGSVCDVVMWCCDVMLCCDVAMLCVMLCCDVVLCCVVMLCVMVCEMLCVMLWVVVNVVVRWNE